MPRVTLTGRIVDAARLVLTQGGRPRIDIASGDHCVLVAERRRHRRFFTYDTGLVETLFVEFDRSLDLGRETFSLTNWQTIGLQIASQRLVYLSMTAIGALNFQHRRENRFLRPAYDGFDVTTSLQFSAPLLDNLREGAITLDWEFKVRTST